METYFSHFPIWRFLFRETAEFAKMPFEIAAQYYLAFHRQHPSSNSVDPILFFLVYSTILLFYSVAMTIYLGMAYLELQRELNLQEAHHAHNPSGDGFWNGPNLAPPFEGEMEDLEEAAWTPTSHLKCLNLNIVLEIK